MEYIRLIYINHTNHSFSSPNQILTLDSMYAIIRYQARWWVNMPELILLNIRGTWLGDIITRHSLEVGLRN